MNEVYAVLDIGSASIELLVGEIINSNLHVLFSKKVPSHGVKKGIIEDENLLVNDIKGVVQEANDFLDGEIKAVGLTIPTIRSKLYQSNSSVSLSDHDKISKDDIVRGLKLSTKFKKSHEEEVVCVIPVRFNGDFGISQVPPIGEASRNLIIDTLIITSQKQILLPEHTGGDGAGGHFPRDVQRPHVLREGIGGEGLLPAVLVAVGKPQPVGVELHPAGLPVFPVQLRIDLLCFILLGMIVFQ